MRKSIFAAVAATAVTAGLLVVPSTVANADEPTCHIDVTFPSQGVLKPRTDGDLTFYATETATPAGCFDVSEHFPFDTRVDGGGRSMDLTYLGQGVYKVVWGADNYLDGDDALLQMIGENGADQWWGDSSWLSDDSAVMAVRYQAYESTKVVSKGRSRTVTATASHFVYNYGDGRTPWERTKVQIQQKKAGKWVIIKSGNTNAAGQLKVKVNTGRASFRSVIVPSSDAIGTAATSAVVTK